MEVIKNQEELDNIITASKDIPKDEKDLLKNNLRAKRELCFALPQDMFRLMSSLQTTKEIWGRLKELYSGNGDFR